MSYKRLTKEKSTSKNTKIVYNENGFAILDKELIEKLLEEHNRLWELENKIENRTLIELPCKVGDKVYKVVKNFIVEYRVHKIEFFITENKQFGYCLYCDNYELGDFDFFYKKQIGEDIFLTKAEAEQRRLKELKGEV